MTNPNQLIVIAAVLDTRYLTLYDKDGGTLLIAQGDPRVNVIVNLCQKHLTYPGAQVTVDISAANHYAEFEEKTGGLVKLFRVAKSKVAEFFGKTEVKVMEPITLGVIPTAKDVPAMTAVVKKRDPVDAAGNKTTHLANAVTEIMQHAVPVKAENFVEPKEDGPDTVVALVDGQVIPDVAALKPQMAAAVLRPGATTKGMEAFLSRLAKVIGKRRHSVEDLMKFLEKGDLPIADDGSIVIYKILKRGGKESDTFYDCHSGNVPQKVGSFVHMDESMVDPDRRQDCSNGLHVARRGYLGNFSGDVCVIAKVAPEDVIAVPQYDANKMRVCGYHILEVLSAETFKRLKTNEAMTNNEADKALLGRVLAGDHIGIQEFVKINGPKGRDIVITSAKNHQPAGVTTRTAMVEAKPVERLVEALPENGCVAPDVDVKAVAAAVTKQKEQLIQAPPGGMSVASKPLRKATKVPSKHTPASVGVDAVNKADVFIGKVPAKEKAKPVKKLSLKDQALALYQGMLSCASLEQKQAQAAALILFKKEKKKSWTDLGFNDSIVKILSDIAAPALPQKGAIFTNAATIAKAEKKVSKKATNIASAKGSVEAQALKSLPVAKSTPPMPAVSPAKKTPIATLWEVFMTNPKSRSAAQDVLDAQKKAKKGWAALGLPTDAGDRLKRAVK